MSSVELSTILQALRAIVLGLLYARWANAAVADGRLDGPEGLILLGKALLIYIVLTVVAGIILQVLAIIAAVIRGEESRPGELDERDREIERRATVKGFSIVGVGFLGMVLALWYNWGAVQSIHVLLAGFIVADVLVNLAKFVSYWRQSA